MLNPLMQGATEVWGAVLGMFLSFLCNQPGTRWESSLEDNESELLDKKAVERVVRVVGVCWLACHSLSLKTQWCVN